VAGRNTFKEIWGLIFATGVAVAGVVLLAQAVDSKAEEARLHAAPSCNVAIFSADATCVATAGASIVDTQYVWHYRRASDHSVTVQVEDGRTVTVNAADSGFAYRHLYPGETVSLRSFDGVVLDLRTSAGTVTTNDDPGTRAADRFMTAVACVWVIAAIPLLVRRLFRKRQRPDTFADGSTRYPSRKRFAMALFAMGPVFASVAHLRAGFGIGAWAILATCLALGLPATLLLVSRAPLAFRRRRTIDDDASDFRRAADALAREAADAAGDRRFG
jgi:hypothetical protein